MMVVVIDYYSPFSKILRQSQSALAVSKMAAIKISAQSVLTTSDFYNVCFLLVENFSRNEEESILSDKGGVRHSFSKR